MAEQVETILRNLGYSGPTLRRFSVGDKFLEEGDIWCQGSSKQKQIDLDDESLLHNNVPGFECRIAGCTETFTSVYSYEIHYNARHSQVCCTCHQIFPSNHLLDLHILETHDSFFQVQATKCNMYRCLIEACPDKFLDATARKEHMISVHKYPASFRFGLQPSKSKKSKNKGKKAKSVVAVDGTASSGDNVPRADVEMKPSKGNSRRGRRGRSSVAMDTTDAAPSADAVMTHSPDRSQNNEDSNYQFSARNPKSVSFGRGVGRGFRSRGKHWHQQGASRDTKQPTSTDSLNVGDLKDAIMDVS